MAIPYKACPIIDLVSTLPEKKIRIKIKQWPCLTIEEFVFHLQGYEQMVYMYKRFHQQRERERERERGRESSSPPTMESAILGNKKVNISR